MKWPFFNDICKTDILIIINYLLFIVLKSRELLSSVFRVVARVLDVSNLFYYYYRYSLIKLRGFIILWLIFYY